MLGGAAQSKNYYSDLLIVKYYLFLIICPMYSNVLYYNIEKSGFNAIYAYLLFTYLFKY